MPGKNQHIRNIKQHFFSLINLLILYFYTLIDPGMYYSFPESNSLFFITIISAANTDGVYKMLVSEALDGLERVLATDSSKRDLPKHSWDLCCLLCLSLEQGHPFPPPHHLLVQLGPAGLTISCKPQTRHLRSSAMGTPATSSCWGASVTSLLSQDSPAMGRQRKLFHRGSNTVVDHSNPPESQLVFCRHCAPR